MLANIKIGADGRFRIAPSDDGCNWRLLDPCFPERERIVGWSAKRITRSKTSASKNVCLKLSDACVDDAARIELKAASAAYRGLKVRDLGPLIDVDFRQRNEDREAARRALLNVTDAVIEQITDTEDSGSEVLSLVRDLIDAQE
ncbi:hypothetical protein [Bradyrhizobium genosp. SA-3]|uniref:hypothetical protein n=1 Tax=Bradyrhizobium genosp. SA-3 TaxID=508868 RepID=UPI001028F51A|nr:hypothetical protein [Bradyrhizobium genosp. SA-3]